MYTEVTRHRVKLTLASHHIIWITKFINEEATDKSQNTVTAYTETITLGNKTLLGDVHMDYLL